jgi:dolichyl-phosphate-mannose--protein O-mannosyl transferase
MCSNVNIDDDWFIRRYNTNTTSYDNTGHLMDGDNISLFHISTNKPALCSHTILLGDGSQEVFCCHGDGSDRNNKVLYIFNSKYDNVKIFCLLFII